MNALRIMPMPETGSEVQQQTCRRSASMNSNSRRRVKGRGPPMRSLKYPGGCCSVPPICLNQRRITCGPRRGCNDHHGDKQANARHDFLSLRAQSLDLIWPAYLTSHLLRLAGGRLGRRWAGIAVRTVCTHTALPRFRARLVPASLARRLATKFVRDAGQARMARS
jgi:hypothetical protein